MKSPRSVAFPAILLIGFFVIGATGCAREGPAEEAGEKIDRGVERAGEAVEEAGEKARDSTD